MVTLNPTPEDAERDSEPTPAGRSGSKWLIGLLCILLPVGFLVWDLWPILAIKQRGDALDQALKPGTPLAHAEAAIRSRELRHTISPTQNPKAVVIKVQRRGHLAPTSLSTGTRTLRVNLVPENPWAMKAALKLANTLPENLDNAIRTAIDNGFENLDARGTPSWQLYEVTSDSLLGRRLN